MIELSCVAQTMQSLARSDREQDLPPLCTTLLASIPFPSLAEWGLDADQNDHICMETATKDHYAVCAV